MAIHGDCIRIGVYSGIRVFSIRLMNGQPATSLIRPFNISIPVKISRGIVTAGDQKKSDGNNSKQRDPSGVKQ